MSFGRWLLVHSFSLFLLALLVLMYLFRAELQLEKAYRQLVSLEPQVAEVKKASHAPKPKIPVNTPHRAQKASAPQSAVGKKSQPVQAVETQPISSPDKLVAVPTLKPAQPEGDELDGDLIRARKAYWANDYARAIDEYQRLIQQHPQNPDYPGELGNIYYTLNNDQRAAELYFQAAMLFLQQNDVLHARSLVAPITALDRELGERLKQRLKR